MHNYAQGGATIDNDVIVGLIVSYNLQEYYFTFGIDTLGPYCISQHPEPLVISSSVKEQVATYLPTDKPRKTDVFCLYAGANEAFSSPAMDFTGSQAVALLNEQIGQLYKKSSLTITASSYCILVEKTHMLSHSYFHYVHRCSEDLVGHFTRPHPHAVY